MGHDWAKTHTIHECTAVETISPPTFGDCSPKNGQMYSEYTNICTVNVIFTLAVHCTLALLKTGDLSLALKVMNDYIVKKLH